MPGYFFMPKEKECPKCGTKHTKRGAFCSQSCGNSRQFTEEDKKNRSKKLKAYHQTPEGLATQEKSRQQMVNFNKTGEMVADGVNVDDFAVDIPEFKDYGDYFDGWSKAEKW